jgi:cytochrome c biogenesis protein CcmG, thiol:disulfide interchange protein DsbE
MWYSDCRYYKKPFVMKAVFFIIITLVSIVCAQAQTESSKAKEMFTHKDLPNIELPDLDGRKVNVAEFGKNGKLTILSFWATWCSPCKKELNNISYLYEDWQNEYDMELIAISIDDTRNTSKVKSYINGQGWDYMVLLDSNEDMKRALNFQTVPFTVLVDRNGKIVYSHSGYVEGDEYILEDKLKFYSK